MYCEKCGNQNADNVLFCAKCGTQLKQPAMMKENNNQSNGNILGKILFAVIGLVVGIAMGIGMFAVLHIGSSKGASKEFAKDFSEGFVKSAGKYEGDGFKTPEDAATAYIEAFSEGDIDKLVSCFAVESSAENYEMVDMLERMRSYVPSMSIKMPNHGSISESINIENRRADITKTITQHYIVLTGWELPLEGMAVSINESSSEEFLEENFPNRESLITDGLRIDVVVEAEEILHDMWTNEANQKNRDALQRTYHAEDMSNLGVVFHTQDGYYLWCAGLIKYHGKWYVDSNISMLASIMGIEANRAGMMYIGDDFDKSMLDEL